MTLATAFHTVRRCSLLLVVVASFVTGCTVEENMGDGPQATPDPVVQPEPESSTLATSTRNDLIWRRYRALEQGLGTALNLAPGDLCTELGRYDCIDQVHLVALGGNDPLGAGMHEPMKSPTATTPVAIERLVLSACDAAVTADAARPIPLIFLDLDLSTDAEPLNLEDELTSLAVGDTVTSLYRRLHARDPLPAEHETVLKIITEDPEPMQARTFALLACFSIASTSESVFQ